MTTDEPSETRAAELVTVAWMLSVMTTLACAVMAALVWFVVRHAPPDDKARLFSQMLHFSAIVTGLVALALQAAVWKVRRQPAPATINVGAAIISLLPIAAALMLER